MRLCGNEVDAGLVVEERDVLPGDLLPVVLLLQAAIAIHVVRCVSFYIRFPAFVCLCVC